MNKKRLTRIIRTLLKVYPSTFFKSNTNNREDPFYVLISTILSQRTRDEVTYPTAVKLFKVLKKPKDFANANTAKIARLIKGVGFYKTKAKRIKQISKILMEKYGGNVPASIEELLKLPGVGRKTANCVLVYGFRQAAIPVDTHVHRVSNRIGIVKTKKPEETEAGLIRAIPRNYWIAVNEIFVEHGQTICKPVNPECRVCPMSEYCQYYSNIGKRVK